jgi:hypothetical protein
MCSVFHSCISSVSACGTFYRSQDFRPSETAFPYSDGAVFQVGDVDVLSVVVAVVVVSRVDGPCGFEAMSASVVTDGFRVIQTIHLPFQGIARLHCLVYSLLNGLQVFRITILLGKYATSKMACLTVHLYCR